MRTSVKSSVDSASGNSSDDREFLGLGIFQRYPGKSVWKLPGLN